MQEREHHASVHEKEVRVGTQIPINGGPRGRSGPVRHMKATLRANALIAGLHLVKHAIDLLLGVGGERPQEHTGGNDRLRIKPTQFF